MQELVGTIGGDDWSLALTGARSNGHPMALRMQGKGIIGGEHWVYDYEGYLVPAWPNGVGQVPAIVGSVIRTTPHSGGKPGRWRRRAWSRPSTRSVPADPVLLDVLTAVAGPPGPPPRSFCSRSPRGFVLPLPNPCPISAHRLASGKQCRRRSAPSSSGSACWPPSQCWGMCGPIGRSPPGAATNSRPTSS